MCLKDYYCLLVDAHACVLGKDEDGIMSKNTTSAQTLAQTSAQTSPHKHLVCVCVCVHRRLQITDICVSLHTHKSACESCIARCSATTPTASPFSPSTCAARRARSFIFSETCVHVTPLRLLSSISQARMSVRALITFLHHRHETPACTTGVVPGRIPQGRCAL